MVWFRLFWGIQVDNTRTFWISRSKFIKKDRRRVEEDVSERNGDKRCVPPFPSFRDAEVWRRSFGCKSRSRVSWALCLYGTFHFLSHHLSISPFIDIHRKILSEFLCLLNFFVFRVDRLWPFGSLGWQGRLVFMKCVDFWNFEWSCSYLPIKMVTFYVWSLTFFRFWIIYTTQFIK